MRTVKLITACFFCLFLSWNYRGYAQDMVPGKKVIIGRNAMIPDNPRTHFARCVNDAPADGETLALNPPRFRWKYHPEGNRGGLFQFIFQIAASPAFEKPVVNVTTPFNFYNTLSPLQGTGPFY